MRGRVDAAGGCSLLQPSDAAGVVYLEPDALTHKLLIVDERDGSEEAEYPIRTLQTRKVLKLAVPVKTPTAGK
jgi:hypothetical protein